jgi:peroxiredoxin
MPTVQKNDIAPDFHCTDIFDKKISLSALRGKTVLLSFFRYSGCPWCNLAIHRLTLEAPKFKSKGLEIITFVQSSRENIIKDIVERHTPTPPFTLIADPKRNIYNLYGVQDSLVAGAKSVIELPSWVDAHFRKGFKQTHVDGSLLLVPAQFVINPQGAVEIAHYGTNYNDHLPFIEIYNVLMFGSNTDQETASVL